MKCLRPLVSPPNPLTLAVLRGMVGWAMRAAPVAVVGFASPIPLAAFLVSQEVPYPEIYNVETVSDSVSIHSFLPSILAYVLLS